jgi:LysM repeat protein
MPTNSRSVCPRRVRTAGVVLAAGLLVGLARPSLWAGGPGSAAPRRIHVVAPGETLWSIAERYGPSGSDPRQYIYDLEQLNTATSGSLVPGEQLTLP